MEKNPTSFKRKEQKFVIIDSTFDEIQDELAKHIPTHSFKKSCPITSIKTIYLDDDNFTIFKEYLARRNYRYKIRFRKYGYDGKFDDELWAELKVKHKKISYKKRFLVPNNLLIPFLQGENIFKEIKNVNQGFVGLRKIYNLMVELMKINEFKPVLETSYDRVAFQKKSKRIRITVDKSIHHKALAGRAAEKDLSVLVFESKIVGKRPKWYKKLEDRLSLLPQKRFSKFATGINSTYFPTRGTYNFYTNFAEIRKKPKIIRRSLKLINSTFELENPDKSKKTEDEE